MQAPEHCALLVIDMQLALVTGAYREQAVLAALVDVTGRARRADLPVIFVQHNHSTFAPMQQGAPGWQLHPELAAVDTDLRIEKTASDAFYQTSLQHQLDNLGVDTLIIAGMQSEYCVDATARRALSQGFDVVLLADCHTTGDGALSASDIIAHHNAALANLAHPDHQITVLDSAELIF
jgi:nicotinamidase-related amidase